MQKRVVLTSYVRPRYMYARAHIWYILIGGVWKRCMPIGGSMVRHNDRGKQMFSEY